MPSRNKRPQPKKKNPSRQRRAQSLSTVLNKVLTLEKKITGTNNASKTIRKKARSVLKGAVDQSIHPAVNAALTAILDPTDRGRPLTGLPCFPANDSFVVRGFLDFTMSTGTNGSGFVSLNPCLTNDTPQVAYSGTTWAGVTLAALNLSSSTLGYNSKAVTNLPYATASFGLPNLAGRVVACGVVLRSITAPLYEQGSIQIFADPNHAVIQGYDSAQISSRRESTYHALRKGEVYEVSTHPVFIGDQNYGVTPQFYNATGATPSANVIAGVLVTGASNSSPVSFLCRYTIDIEYSGTLTEPNVQPRIISPPGAFENIVQIVSHAHKHRANNPTVKSKDLLRLAKNAYKFINSPAGATIASAFTA